MNENLNLVDILKDCPKDTKLYSIMHNEVKFSEIREDSIICKTKILEKTLMPLWLNCEFCKDGTIKGYPGIECVLFPSKDQRDWSKFKVEPEMIDGEIYYVKTKYAEWIYIYKKNYTYETGHYVAVLNNYHMEFNSVCTTRNDEIKILRKATEEEKRLFFETIEENGRKWDANKKELIKVEPKFDISTLQPFDKVLTRDWDYSVWRCNFYEGFKEGPCYQFIIMNGLCSNQCIPYNDETKHLRGTTEMPPEKYITWK